MNFILRGAALSITRADILAATRDVPPAPIDGRNKYFVELHGRSFPIKQVLRLVTGLPPLGFTAQDAHRILSRLGFDIVEYHGPAPAAAGAPPRAAGKTGSLLDRVLRRPRGDREGPPRAAGDPDPLLDPDAGHQDDGEVLRLLVVFQTDEDGWEVASCPTLPGCHSQGRTREEALDNVQEAIKGYLASLREHEAAQPASSEFQIIEVRA